MIDSGQNPWEGIESPSPSVRLRAASELAQLQLDTDQRARILALIQHEPVPQVRSRLNQLLRSKTKPTLSEVVAPSDQGSGDDLAALIAHELAPAIGRLEFEASLEVPSFEDSETAKAIQKLSARVSALVKIASTRRDRLQRRPSNLIELVQAAIPTDADVVVEVNPESASDDYFSVDTDPQVAALLLGAALDNAVEANVEAQAVHPVVAEVAGSEASCVVSISNRFLGDSLNRSEVQAMGRSTKYGGRGTGMRVIAQSASALGVDWEIRGTAGVATFVVRFER